MPFEPTKASAQNGVGLLNITPDGIVVELLDLDVLVAADRDGGGIRVLGIFPGKDDVIGGEWRAVMPFDALLQLPDHREAVFLQAVIVLARNLGCQHRNQITVAVPSRQRLIEHAGTFLVLGADGEMRIQQRHRLPVQQLQRAAAAGLGRLVGHLGSRPGHSRTGSASCRRSARSGRRRSFAARRPAVTGGLPSRRKSDLEGPALSWDRLLSFT